MPRPKNTIAETRAQIKAAKRKESELKKPSSMKKVSVVIKPVKSGSIIAAAKAKVLKTTVSAPTLFKGTMVPVKGAGVIAKRHQKEHNKKTPLERITRAVIGKIAKKSGIKRLSNFGDKVRQQWLAYMRTTVQDTMIISEYMRRKTMSIEHVKLASERHGERLYCENGI